MAATSRLYAGEDDYARVRRPVAEVVKGSPGWKVRAVCCAGGRLTFLNPAIDYRLSVIGYMSLTMATD